jgi:hypothetical protein
MCALDQADANRVLRQMNSRRRVFVASFAAHERLGIGAPSSGYSVAKRARGSHKAHLKVAIFAADQCAPIDAPAACRRAAKIGAFIAGERPLVLQSRLRNVLQSRENIG